MKYVREGLLLPERASSTVDESLFEQLDHLTQNNLATYKQMSVEGERKADALSDLAAGFDVDLTVHDMSEEELQDRIGNLKLLKKQVIENSENIDESVIELYRWKINETIANLHMIDASRRKDMTTFMRWNEFIYGKPDEDVYRAALDWIAHDAERLRDEPEQNPAVVEAAGEVITLLENERGYREIISPLPEAFEEVRQDHMCTDGYYGMLLSGVEVPDQKISKDIGDPIIQHVVKNNLQSDYGLIDSTSATWSVSHTQEAVERPPNYNLPAKRFIGLALGHETGSHLLEKENGERGPLRLLRKGLDRYELGNEGRATIREQVVYGSFDEFSKLVRWRDVLRRHIGISYAAGVGADAPRKSKEVYRFMNAIDRLYQTKLNPDDPALVGEKSHAKTGTLVTRILRGVDGEQGGAYLKDITYLEGHVACWLSAAEAGPQAISDGDLGKFDIANQRHIEVLQQHGLLSSAKEIS